MTKEDYMQILQEQLKSSAGDWVLGAAGCSQWSQTHIESGEGMAKVLE